MRKFLPVVLLSLVTLNACSSKKTNTTPEAETSFKEELVLNGSSDEGKAGQLRTIHFAYNADGLDQTAKELLKKNADYLSQNTQIAIQIEGHCDERGGRQFNLALGERRAKAIRDYLRALGVKPYRMKTFSWGNERPIDEAGTDSAMARNRRGTFVVISL